MVIQLRINIMYHIDKCRTAGSRHLLSFLISLCPFICFAGCGHVSAKADFYRIFKAYFFQCFFPAFHGNVCTELAFCGWRNHCIYLFAGFERFNYIYDKGLGTDGTKRTVMDALAAADAFFLINNRNVVLVICNRIYRTCYLARTLHADNRIVRACLCTLAAFPALGRVDIGTVTAHGNRPELAGVHAGLSKTVLAVVCNGVTGNRTSFTGRTDNLNDVSIILRAEIFAFCQAHSLADDFPFLVNTAAELRYRAWNQLFRNKIALFFQRSVKSQLCYFIQHVMLDFNDILIIVHTISPICLFFLPACICFPCSFQ